MSSRTLQARVINIHDVESRWTQAETFIPRLGEIVIYDPDNDHPYSRFKIGDGKRTTSELPFAVEAAIQTFFGETSGVIYHDGGSINDYI